MVYNNKLQRFLLVATIIITFVSITACGSPAIPNTAFTAPTIEPISEGANQSVPVTSSPFSGVATPTTGPTMTTSLVFPQQPRPTDDPVTSMAALLTGTLIIDGQCLRVRDDHNESWLPIWNWNHVLHVEQGTVSIQDTTGQTLARVGDTIRLGGGEFNPGPSFWQTATPSQPTIPAPCPGPYWGVSEIQQ
jgi:hypothetical protein